MVKRPTPKSLTPDEQNAINAASAEQTGKASVQKTYDPDYPVFDVPVNQKVLVYIPRHMEMLPDGTSVLRMDKFAAHPILDGRRFGDIRCTQGVVAASLGLDGTCPLCDCMDDAWTLYNKEYDDIARAKGIDPKAPEAKEALKEDRKNCAGNMAVKNAEVWMVFPIVVIACVEKDGRWTVTPQKDAEGRITGTPMWYQIRERTYLDKWIPAFDALEGTEDEGDMSPAGRWAILNFCYTPKSGSHDKMGSARALNVSFKDMPGYEEWATYFDQLTEGWTKEKAQEVLVLDAVRDMDEMRQVADSVIKPTRDKLALYNLAAGGAGAAALPQMQAPSAVGNADAVLSQFGATPVTGGADDADTGTGQVPVTGGEMPNTGVE